MRVTLGIIVAVCGSVTFAQTHGATVGMTAQIPSYSLVFIIHGDGDYVYHDNRGKVRKADEHALNGAIQVALRNPEAEVYIFHQRPARFAFFFFRLQDGDFRYYRNGQLIVEDTYWRSNGPSRFDSEVKLYQQYSAVHTVESAKFFLYYGHEISEFSGVGYDSSYPDRSFNVRDLSEGLKNFTGDSTKFDLLVLSTCFGGTPHTIASLAPFTRTIVASPENLHLSYLDLHLFEQIGVYVRNDDISRFAEFYARQAFNRLSDELQTAVTVAVYDLDRTRKYLNSVDSIYMLKLAELQSRAPAGIEYVDCEEESSYVMPGMNDGVYVLYRAAQFGRSKNKRSHSGWQCCRPLVH